MLRFRWRERGVCHQQRLAPHRAIDTASSGHEHVSEHSGRQKVHRGRIGDGRTALKTASVNAAAYECVNIKADGGVATVYLKRRDLLRLFDLDPRDLRRIDPHLQYTRNSPTMYTKGSALLVQLAGVRLIITAKTALVLDPHSSAAKQFLGTIIPQVQVSAGQRLMQQYAIRQMLPSGAKTYESNDGRGAPLKAIPFELDVLEAALGVAVTKLDGELRRAQERVTKCSKRLPKDITPQNLDQLRRVKSTLVELESASDAYRQMLEDIFDDEDELKDFNLSSRVLREERRKLRERDRLERELSWEISRDREADAPAADEREGGVDPVPRGSTSPAATSSPPVLDIGPDAGPSPSRGAAWDSAARSPGTSVDAAGAALQGGYGAWERSLELSSDVSGSGSEPSDAQSDEDGALSDANGASEQAPLGSWMGGDASRAAGEQTVDIADSGTAFTEPEALGTDMKSALFEAEYLSQVLNRIEAVQEMAAGSETEKANVLQELRDLYEAEAEELEMQEVEDLLEFYLQRTTAIQTEAERLLAGARDLEESIGLTLSARRFEVQRLELRLSIGSFAAALGAVVAGIFGMNLRSTLEESILGFWGTTALIIAGCVWVYVQILEWTKRRKILV